jgi:hypothetical protein
LISRLLGHVPLRKDTAEWIVALSALYFNIRTAMIYLQAMMIGTGSKLAEFQYDLRKFPT